MKKLSGLLLFYCVFIYLPAQKFYFPRKAFLDSAELSKAMPALANRLIKNYRESDYRDSVSDLSRLQVLAGRFSEADITLDSLRYFAKETDPEFWSLVAVQYKLYVRAKLKQAATGASFGRAFEEVCEDLFRKLDDKKALHIYTAFQTRNGIDELQ